MKKITIMLAMASLLGVSSCREEILQTELTKSKVEIADATVKNGRLYFPNKESFRNTLNEIKTKPDEEINKFIEKFDYEPLQIIVTENNEKAALQNIKKRKSKILQINSARISDDEILEDLDDMEEIIGDEAYATMLNGDAEVQVGNDVYKYTDVGLFVTPVEDYSVLVEYLDDNQISDNLLVETDYSVRESYVASQPSGILVPVSEEISYFNSIEMMAPVDDYDTGSYGATTNISNVVEPSMGDIVKNLKVGIVKKPWLGNRFGTTWVTYDKYEDRRRVKVKFYSQNLFLAYVVGCKVKHQYKGWTGLWRKENADKLGMGVNAIKWTFAHNINTNISSNGIPKQVYWQASNMYTSNNGINFSFKQNVNIPSIPFANNIDCVIQFVSDLSGLDEEQLNKLFWDTAWKKAKQISSEQNSKLEKVVFVVDTFNSTYFRYYDFSQVQSNQDKIEKIFDWGVATPLFTYNFGGGTSSLSVSKYTFDFTKPTAVSVNMYGVAKKNGTWHGVILDAK